MTSIFDNSTFPAYADADTSTLEKSMTIGSVTAGTVTALESATKITKKALEKAAKASEKAAKKAAAEAKETAIALAVKDALAKGSTIAHKYEATESEKVAFKDNSRHATYGLLVEILAFVEELNKRADLTDVLAAMKVELWKNWKLKTQENTSELGVIVKYITRTKRKNAHMYSRVLEQALKHKATSENLLQYIGHCGGINKIVASSKEKSIDNKKRLYNAYKRYANAVLTHEQHDGGMGKIPLTPSQQNHHYDTRGNAHFVYTFCKIERNELVVIDFVPWVNQDREAELLLNHTLNTIKVPGNSTHLDEAMSGILHKKMAVMFEKYNARYLKRNLPSINHLGEAATGNHPNDFSVFNWEEFEQEYADYLAAKAQPAE